MAVLRGISSHVSTFLISLILIQGLSRCFGSLEITYPEQDTLVIEANSNVTFICNGTQLVSWIHPNSTILSEKFSTIETNISKNDNNYSAFLHLTNASYLDTGFYICLSSDESEEEKSFYLFVKDEEHLTVTRDNEIINVIQGDRAVIPCRPTFPEVKVDLLKETGDKNNPLLMEKVPLNEINEDGTTFIYDLRFGFIIDKVAKEEYQFYDCFFTWNGLTQRRTLFLGIQSAAEPVDEPFVEDLNNGRTVEGETINLSCTLRTMGNFDLTWIIPNPKAKEEGRVQEDKPNNRISEAEHVVYLRITNVTMEDRGVYYCVVKDIHHEVESHVYVNIYDADEHFIKLQEDNGIYEISVVADGKSTVGWAINVSAHPIPKLIWYNNKNQMIEEIDWFADKYKVAFSPERAIIEIYNVSISDRGFYELRAYNKYETESVKLFLNVSGKPSLNLQKQDFYMINKPAFAHCSVTAFPKPTIYWTMEMCTDNTCDPLILTSKETEKSDYEIDSVVTIRPNSSGMLTCHAYNSFGNSNITVNFVVTDVEHGFGIWSPNDILDSQTTGSGVLGETIVLYCGAAINYYSDQLNWYINQSNSFLNITNDHYKIEESYTEYSYRSILTINQATVHDNGNYSCKGVEISNDFQNVKITYVILTFKEPEAPIITESNLNNDVLETNTPDQVEFICKAEGTPKPEVAWYKNYNYIWNFNQTRMKLIDNGQKLQFSYTLVEDEGIYTCRAENRYGIAEKSLTLKFKNKSKIFIYIIAAVVVAAVVVIALIFVVIREQRQKKKLLQELKSIGFMNFEKGNLENLNPELGVDDQAELLPYDKKFEFPREKLKLGKQLGAGAFGIVVKAEAKGLIMGEDSTTVAVKMVKRNADASHIKSLASELKIMVHLGNHLNVVNLLGACTKDTAKTRELLVIVEYCRFGNLHNFLIRHRQNFINQIDPKTKNVDFTIGNDILQRTFSISSNNSDAAGISNEYRGENSAISYGTTRTLSTTVSSTQPDDMMITSCNSVQPEWRSNYRGDYKGVVKMIATKDLISWAFQVARGMEYLASRKVLHGDLAARNILLSDNNVVKICDFGLAKSIYKDNNYQKKGDGLLPVKWMAVESIQDRIFSTQSDVWSFGIVLWEFFSLARTPYPGMEANERLYQKLIEGYRMDCPDFASKEIYKIMLDCWHPNPICRPSFTKLADDIGLMLEDSVKQHYIDLNDPYLKMNTNRLEKQEDYLAMLSPPDFINLSSPNNYINEPIINETSSPTSIETPGYLCMKPSNIFSPSPLNTSTFVFDSNRKSPEDFHRDGVIEMEPMLGGNNESDYESQPNSPTLTTSFSNPSYHLASKITPEKDDRQIIHSTNNYVNMPQNKNAIVKSATEKINDKETDSNEFQHNYVNSNSRDWEKVLL